MYESKRLEMNEHEHYKNNMMFLVIKNDRDGLSSSIRMYDRETRMTCRFLQIVFEANIYDGKKCQERL